jgi:hypothetical protein
MADAGESQSATDTAAVKTVNGRLVVIGTKGGNVRINDGESLIALSPSAAIELADHLRAAAQRLQAEEEP